MNTDINDIIIKTVSVSQPQYIHYIYADYIDSLALLILVSYPESTLISSLSYIHHYHWTAQDTDSVLPVWSNIRERWAGGVISGLASPSPCVSGLWRKYRESNPRLWRLPTATGAAEQSRTPMRDPYKQWDNEWMNGVQATILHCKAVRRRGQPRIMRWLLEWIITCWPAVQHATTVPWLGPTTSLCYYTTVNCLYVFPGPTIQLIYLNYA